MKRLLNTLFVTTQNAYLHKEGESVLVKIDGETKLRLPLHNLDGIVSFGAVTMSPFLMGHCAEKDVAVSFLTEYGRFLARVSGPVAGNVLLRREQYRRADKGEQANQLARSFLCGKIANSRAVVRRALRDHRDKIDDTTVLETVESRLTQFIRRLDRIGDYLELMGVEGTSAADYFSVFDQLVTSQKDVFTFNHRSRRPPMDKINAMLSFVYTLLVHDCRSALETVGLDPYVGYLHRDRPGRPSLALDMMEEFRSWLADRLVLSLINRQQIKPTHFRETENGAVLLNEDGRKIVLVAWQKRKQEETIHPYLGEKMPIGLLFHIQARLLSRYLRNDLDAYPPFFWK